MKSPKLLLLIFFSAILFNSCKKDNGQSLATQKTEPVDVRKYMSPEAFTSLKERFDKEGRSFTVNIDKKVEMYYSDQSGKRIEPSARRSFVSACTGFTDAYATLISYKQNYDCNNGYKLTWKYEISTDNKIVVENPYFSLQKTKGIIRTFEFGTTPPIYTQLTYKVDITDLGTDLDYGPGYEKYSVEFTSDRIPEIYISGAMVIGLKLGANLAIDCDNGTAPVSIALDDFSLPNYTSGDACGRNDKVWIIPFGGINNKGFIINGVDPFGTCPVGYAYPSCQEVQYSVDGGPWQDIQNALSGSVFYNTTYLYRWDVAYPPLLPTGTYSYKFRYRNINSCEPVNDYAYETWEITY